MLRYKIVYYICLKIHSMVQLKNQRKKRVKKTIFLPLAINFFIPWHTTIFSKTTCLKWFYCINTSYGLYYRYYLEQYSYKNDQKFYFQIFTSTIHKIGLKRNFNLFRTRNTILEYVKDTFKKGIFFDQMTKAEILWSTLTCFYTDRFTAQQLYKCIIRPLINQLINKRFLTEMYI